MEAAGGVDHQGIEPVCCACLNASRTSGERIVCLSCSKICGQSPWRRPSIVLEQPAGKRQPITAAACVADSLPANGQSCGGSGFAGSLKTAIITTLGICFVKTAATTDLRATRPTRHKRFLTTCSEGFSSCQTCLSLCLFLDRGDKVFGDLKLTSASSSARRISRTRHRRVPSSAHPRRADFFKVRLSLSDRDQTITLAKFRTEDGKRKE